MTERERDFLKNLVPVLADPALEAAGVSPTEFTRAYLISELQAIRDLAGAHHDRLTRTGMSAITMVAALAKAATMRTAIQSLLDLPPRPVTPAPVPEQQPEPDEKTGGV